MDTSPWLLIILFFTCQRGPWFFSSMEISQKEKIPQGEESKGAYLGSPIFIVKDPSLGHLCQETFWYLQQSLSLSL